MPYRTGPIKAAAFIAAALFATLVICGAERESLAGSDTVLAEEGWRQEFEIVCSRTEDAMTLGADELKVLIGKCDKLKPAVERLPESPRKVYLKRLQRCRDLYVFVLESKEKEKDSK